MTDIIVKPYEDIVNDIVERLLTANPELTDLNESSIIRMLIETYSLELSSEEFSGVYQQIVDVYNATRISTATGDDLEELGSLLGITRDTGSKANLQETFIRSSPASADFTIPINSTVSTVAEGDGSLIKFLVDSDTVFQASIADELHNFVDGLYKYKLEQRLLDSITTLYADVSSVSTLLVLDTDYEIETDFDDDLIDNDSIVDIDRCEATTDWTNSTDALAIAIDNANYIEGSNSLALGKDGIVSITASYEKTYAAGVDTSGLNPIVNLYVKDQTTLDKLASLVVNFGSTSADYIINAIDPSTLVVGWNEIKLTTNLSIATGSPLLDDVRYFKIAINTNNVSDTLASGDINLDFFYFADYENYRGTIINFLGATKPDNNTDLTITYVPLSVEVDMTAEFVGIEHNVGPDKVTNKISELTTITTVNNYESGYGGEDTESDDDLRERILNATTGLGKATVSALQTAIEELDHVTTATIIDMPLLDAQEVITFATGDYIYDLDNEVAQQDDYLKVTIDRTTLSADIDDSVTTIPLVAITNLPVSALDDFKFVRIGTEIIQYDTIATLDLTGCTRGALNTEAAAHTSGDTVAFFLSEDEDFIIDEYSRIEFTTAGETAGHIVDADEVDVDYQYRWLGHFKVYASGPYAFTTAENEAVVEIIEETKAAGINYVYTIPTSLPTNVDASIKVLSGYAFEEVKANVITSITTLLNSYDIGESVYLSQIINAIQEVEGVEYTSLTTPAADIIVDEDSIIKPGTIVISEL